MKFRLKSGKILYVVGKSPEKPGDKFEAALEPVPGKKPRERGCEFGTTADGARFIQCTRGQEPVYLPIIKTYKFDPEIHEVVED